MNGIIHCPLDNSNSSNGKKLSLLLLAKGAQSPSKQSRRLSNSTSVKQLFAIKEDPGVNICNGITLQSKIVPCWSRFSLTRFHALLKLAIKDASSCLVDSVKISNIKFIKATGRCNAVLGIVRIPVFEPIKIDRA